MTYNIFPLVHFVLFDIYRVLIFIIMCKFIIVVRNLCCDTCSHGNHLNQIRFGGMGQSLSSMCLRRLPEIYKCQALMVNGMKIEVSLGTCNYATYGGNCIIFSRLFHLKLRFRYPKAIFKLMTNALCFYEFVICGWYVFNAT